MIKAGDINHGGKRNQGRNSDYLAKKVFIKRATTLFVLFTEITIEHYALVACYSCGPMIDKLIEFNSLNPSFMREVISLYAQKKSR